MQSGNVEHRIELTKQHSAKRTPSWSANAWKLKARASSGRYWPEVSYGLVRQQHTALPYASTITLLWMLGNALKRVACARRTSRLRQQPRCLNPRAPSGAKMPATTARATCDTRPSARNTATQADPNWHKAHALMRSLKVVIAG